jgi:hypothetical protein
MSRQLETTFGGALDRDEESRVLLFNSLVF